MCRHTHSTVGATQKKIAHSTVAHPDKDQICSGQPHLTKPTTPALLNCCRFTRSIRAHPPWTTMRAAAGEGCMKMLQNVAQVQVSLPRQLIQNMAQAACNRMDVGCKGAFGTHSGAIPMWDRQSHRAPTPGLGRHTSCPVIIQPTPVPPTALCPLPSSLAMCLRTRVVPRCHGRGVM
jgi:hypothetical protein